MTKVTALLKRKKIENKIVYLTFKDHNEIIQILNLHYSLLEANTFSRKEKCTGKDFEPYNKNLPFEICRVKENIMLLDFEIFFISAFKV